MNPTTEKYRDKIKNAAQPNITTIPPEVNAIRSALNIPQKETQLNLESKSSSENLSPPPLISAPPEDDRQKKDTAEVLRQLNEEMRQRGIITPTGNNGPRRGNPGQPYNA